MKRRQDGGFPSQSATGERAYESDVAATDDNGKRCHEDGSAYDVDYRDAWQTGQGETLFLLVGRVYGDGATVDLNARAPVRSVVVVILAALKFGGYAFD